MPHYLGNPLSLLGMRRLPAVASEYAVSLHRPGSGIELIAGGYTAARALEQRTARTLAWKLLDEPGADLIAGFHNRAWGAGPYALIDSSWSNLLKLDTSLCGGRRGVVTGWNVPAGQTVASDLTVATQQPPGGVMRWVGAGNGSILTEGPQGTVVSFVGQGEPDTAAAVPYVADQPYTAELYVRTATSTASLTVRASGRNAAGTVHTNATATATANTSGWARLAVTATAGTLASQFVIVTLLCNTAAAPDILICCPRLSLLTATQATATTWVSGMGTPRCVIPPDDLALPLIPRARRRGVELVLREV